MRCEVQRVDIHERMRSLRRCGCDRCYREYRELEELTFRTGHRYMTSDHLATLRDVAPYILPRYDAPLMMGVDEAANDARPTVNSTAPVPAKPAPEIKNPAVKLLADRLKVVEADRATNARQVETYKNYAKEYGTKVATADKEAAHLRRALKRLGHAV